MELRCIVNVLDNEQIFLQVVLPLLDVEHSSVLPAGFYEGSFARIGDQFVYGACCDTPHTYQFLFVLAVHQSQVTKEA